MILTDVTEAIGCKPLVRLDRLGRGLPGRIAAKLESANPCSSVKDRLGLALIQDGERRGVLQPGATIIEATGGNTGIGLACAAAVRGYRLVLTMPEAMSVERLALLRQLGAEVVLTPGILMADAVERARQLLAETPDAVMLDQFSNAANPELHRRTTGPEIWEATGGGTITGVGEVLKGHKPGVRVVAVEPAGAAVLSGRPAGQHRIPGIGVGFVPAVLNLAIIDEVMAVTDDDAFDCARRLACEEGIVAGASAGAALHAALQIAGRDEFADKLIVVLVADTGER
jgi:cysteine synthase